MSIKELDSLLVFLAEKKRKMEQEEAERNMQILLDFLHCLRKQKVEELNEVCFHLLSVDVISFLLAKCCCCSPAASCLTPSLKNNLRDGG